MQKVRGNFFLTLMFFICKDSETFDKKQRHTHQWMVNEG